MIAKNHIECTIRAPYYTLGALTESTQRVWLVFHGYGQLARYFIKKFEVLDLKKNFIIAPQGLSRYYLEGVYGRVGASWMTKEDRLTEIENQYRYLQSVLQSVGDLSKRRLVYFGFSQGTATMGRFAAHAKLPFEKMVIWAGTFPSDTGKGAYAFMQGTETIHYYTSKDDPYFKEEMLEQQDEVVREATGQTPVLHWYEGGHRVIPERLAEI